MFRGELGREGFGADVEEDKDPVAEEEILREIDDFDLDWRGVGRDDIFDEVLDVLKSLANIEELRTKLKALSRELAACNGDEEDELKVFNTFLKQESKETEEDDEDEEDEDSL
jgi:hypothetical protein